MSTIDIRIVASRESNGESVYVTKDITVDLEGETPAAVAQRIQAETKAEAISFIREIVDNLCPDITVTVAVLDQ